MNKNMIDSFQKTIEDKSKENEFQIAQSIKHENCETEQKQKNKEMTRNKHIHFNNTFQWVKLPIKKKKKKKRLRSDYKEKRKTTYFCLFTKNTPKLE